MLAAGFERDPFPPSPSITDLAGIARRHFGLETPASRAALALHA
jgi:hypothetical protein